MRYTPPPFTVEVRRTTRRGTGATAQAWLTEVRPQRSELDRASFLAANAPFRTSAAEEPQIAPPHRGGRILPSLIDEDARNRPIPDLSTLDEAGEELTVGTATRAQPAPQRRVRATKSPIDSQRPADALAADDSATVRASDDHDRPNQTEAAQLHPSSEVASPKARKRDNSRPAASVSSKQIPFVSVAEDQISSAEQTMKANSPVDMQESPKPARKSRIMGRYVIGDELKPGEQWKRSLRWKRRRASGL